MYYPGGMKARVSPVQWSKPYSILAPTQDSNPSGWIQSHKWWPLHYHGTQWNKYCDLNGKPLNSRSCAVLRDFWYIRLYVFYYRKDLGTTCSVYDNKDNNRTTDNTEACLMDCQPWLTSEIKFTEYLLMTFYISRCIRSIVEISLSIFTLIKSMISWMM